MSLGKGIGTPCLVLALTLGVFAAGLDRRPLARDVSIKAGPRTVPLSAGTEVEVVSVVGTRAFVRITLPTGGTAMGEVPADALGAVKAPATVPTPTAPPAPPPTRDAPATEPRPPTGPAWLEPGWHEDVVLDELPDPPKKPKWFPYGFTAAEEKFRIYVPRTRRPGQPCGLLGWTSANDASQIPQKFEPLFDEFRLIAVTAANCGNKQKTSRRAGLLTSAMLCIAKHVGVDPRRCILSGMSGGGRLSALGVFVHPELWKGAICWCGGNYYRDYPDSAKPGYVSYGFPRAHEIPDAASESDVRRARKECKFVLLTGSKDFNLSDSRDIEKAMRDDKFDVLLIEEEGLAHQVGSPENMRKAIEFVLGPPPG